MRCLKGLGCTLALLVIVCLERIVKDILEESQGARYSQVLETPMHRVEVRFVSEAAALLQSAGISGDRAASEKLLDSIRQARGLGPGLQFILRLSPKKKPSGPGFENDVVYGNISGFADLHQAMRQFTFGLGKKVWLESGDIRIPMSNYTMENSFGISPSRTVILMFPPMKRDWIAGGQVNLVLDDIVLGLSREKLDWTRMAVENAHE